MSTVTKNRIRQARQYSGPSGNKFAKVFRFNVNASGVCPDSDLATAVVPCATSTSRMPPWSSIMMR